MSNDCSFSFNQAEGFDYQAPGTVKYQIDSDYLVVNNDGQYRAVGLATYEDGIQRPIATDICDHEAVIARQKGMPVYNNYDELQSVAEQLTPEHGAWNDIFEFAIEDKFPTGEYQFKPEGLGLQ